MIFLKLKTAVGFAVLVVTFCGAVTALSYRPAPMPHGEPVANLWVADDTIDLGSLLPDELREVPFSIENKGLRRLVLNEIDRECGCGMGLQSMILIPPGSTSEVVVSVNTRFQTGAITTSTIFTTNDPIQPRICLTVKGWIHPDPRAQTVSATAYSPFND